MTQKIKHNLRKIKDPGSALTHFIAMVLAAAAAVPLLPLRVPGLLNSFIWRLWLFLFLSMIGLYGASTIYHTLDISPKINQLLRKIDHMMIFCAHCRNLHARMPDRTGRSDGMGSSGTGLGHRCPWDLYQRLLDHLSQMVFFHDLHCHGLGLHPGLFKDTGSAAKSRLSVASGRRHHLHPGRRHLRPETAYFQCETPIFRFP